MLRVFITSKGYKPHCIGYLTITMQRLVAVGYKCKKRTSKLTKDGGRKKKKL